jgi:hypothetical protein
MSELAGKGDQYSFSLFLAFIAPKTLFIPTGIAPKIFGYQRVFNMALLTFAPPKNW